MKNKQYIKVSLITRRTYLGYVNESFEPNLEEEISFTLYNVHVLHSKYSGEGEPNFLLRGIEEGPDQLIPQMDIMWHAVAAIQYLKDDSQLIKQMDEKEKAFKHKSPKNKAELVLLKKENRRK